MGLDAKVQDCDNAIQRLSKRSNRLVALLKAVTKSYYACGDWYAGSLDGESNIKAVKIKAGVT